MGHQLLLPPPHLSGYLLCQLEALAMPERASRLAARKTRQMARELRLLQGVSRPWGATHPSQRQKPAQTHLPVRAWHGRVWLVRCLEHLVAGGEVPEDEGEEDQGGGDHHHQVPHQDTLPGRQVTRWGRWTRWAGGAGEANGAGGADGEGKW